MSSPSALPKLVRGSLKLRLALISLLVLGVGYLLAPPANRRNRPSENVVPILQAEVQRREPARVFRGVQDVGRKALAYAVSFPGPPGRRAALTHADFADTPLEPTLPTGLGVIVSAQGTVLTQISAVSGSVAPAVQLPGGRLVTGRLRAYEPHSGLALVQVDPGPDASAAGLAKAPPEPGELVVAAARIGGRELVAPLFVASADGETYTLSATSGIVFPGTPVYNLEGELVALAAGSPAVSRAWAVGPALERLAALRAGPRALPRTLGLALQPLDGALAGRMGGPGVLVSDVAQNGPADRAGVEPGDVLEAIGGTQLASVHEAQALVAAGGEELVLRLRRGTRVREARAAPLPVLAPPAAVSADATGTPARLLFTPSTLEGAGVGNEARVIAIERTPVGSEAEAKRQLRRLRPPWLVYLQEGERRFFALVGESRT